MAKNMTTRTAPSATSPTALANPMMCRSTSAPESSPIRIEAARSRSPTGARASRASLAGRAVPLTATEWEVLRILSVNAGRVVTSESLLRQAWNARDAADTEPVRAFVKKLRAKLGDDASDPACIFTERGVGYRMPRPG